MDIRIKRVYDAPAGDDGFRVLVDRLWPRGLTKDAAKVDLWLKDIAPSDLLRKWFGHETANWEEFRRRYSDELADAGDFLDRLLAEARQGTVTLLYAAHDQEHNNAVVLRDRLEAELRHEQTNRRRRSA
jgi:uncharacterized protein YeaO (DUF488 family)